MTRIVVLHPGRIGSVQVHHQHGAQQHPADPGPGAVEETGDHARHECQGNREKAEGFPCFADGEFGGGWRAHLELDAPQVGLQFTGASRVLQHTDQGEREDGQGSKNPVHLSRNRVLSPGCELFLPRAQTISSRGESAPCDRLQPVGEEHPEREVHDVQELGGNANGREVGDGEEDPVEWREVPPGQRQRSGGHCDPEPHHPAFLFGEGRLFFPQRGGRGIARHEHHQDTGILTGAAPATLGRPVKAHRSPIGTALRAVHAVAEESWYDDPQ